MRCVSCGATNPEAAGWCGQCYEPLATEPVPAGEQSPSAGAADDGVFRRGEEGFEWACPKCGAYTSLDVRICGECGTSMTQLSDEHRPVAASTNWTAAYLLSAAIPGLGHLVVRRPGQAVARGLLYLLWLSSGLALLVGAAGLPAIPLLLGAATLWVTGLWDIRNLQNAEPEVLTARGFLWLVVAVIGLLLLALLGAVPRP